VLVHFPAFMPFILSPSRLVNRLDSHVMRRRADPLWEMH
jgi:hypothetical protein